MLKMSTGSIEPSPSPSPGSFPTTISIPNGVPKVGTLVPNRVFVGGISSNTTESELHQLFSEFGNVKQTKIIADRAGVSKGYGFVTFETEEEARRLQDASQDIVLKERKLNIAPAIKKQAYGRSYEMGQPVVNGAIYYHNGIPYTYQQNGVAMFVDGQPCLGGGVVSPTSGKASTPSTPFSLVYPGTGGTMFVPSPAAAVSQQQLQLQAAAALREAVQSQTGGSGSTSQGSGAAWRWITPQTTTVGSTGTCNQSPSAATSPAAQSNPANHQLNQALAFNQTNSGFVPLDPFHYFQTGFPANPGMGLSSLPHPGFVIPDRTF